GSNLGLGYAPQSAGMTALEAARVQHDEFHNIYIDPAAYEAFVRTGRFPDHTVLVMEHYAAEKKEPNGVLVSGVFNGMLSGLEVAVKNAHRPDGSTTPWAYYVFTDSAHPSTPLAQAAAFPDQDCNACHVKHAGFDNVWVQFYPILRDV